MSQFRFRIPELRDSPPREWLRVWAARYQSDDDLEYSELIAKHESLSATDYERIGKWKDGVETALQWRLNVTSVAYLIWMEAAVALPRCPAESDVESFLDSWSRKAYRDEYKSGSREKHFGLSRATTLLHFVSGGRFPIFDARVRTAIFRLLGPPVPLNTVRWYLDSCCPLFAELAALCEADDDVRILDKALFSYGSFTAIAFSS